MMSGFGYTVLGFGSHPNRGTPLGITLNSSGVIDITVAVPDATLAYSVQTVGGEINVTASATGGDTSGDGYAYAWTVIEDSDIPGASGASCSLTTAGTQNAAQYNTARWTVIVGIVLGGGGAPTGNEPFVEATYTLTCTVTDDNGDEAQATAQVRIRPGV
jgi:hypothetical protein